MLLEPMLKVLALIRVSSISKRCQKHAKYFLLPPGIAEYSKAPAAEWFATRLPELLDAQAGVVQCIQEGGEAMYVPAGWGKTL